MGRERDEKQRMETEPVSPLVTAPSPPLPAGGEKFQSICRFLSFCSEAREACRQR